jgi:hypothetical protein
MNQQEFLVLKNAIEKKRENTGVWLLVRHENQL